MHLKNNTFFKFEGATRSAKVKCRSANDSKWRFRSSAPASSGSLAALDLPDLTDDPICAEYGFDDSEYLGLLSG